MPVTDELVERVTQLPPDELEELIARVSARDRPAGANGDRARGSEFSSNVVRTPGVCGGSARIIRTRIPVWLLEQYRRLGMSEGELLRAYPSLRAIDLVEAWRYADSRAEEMDREIRENEED
jgi:uncharacterized protein (DUF433 family)